MSDHTKLDALINSMDLAYSTEFVPQSKSRNASEKGPSLNWRVTIKSAGRVLTTDYTQGMGHLPKDSNCGFNPGMIGHAWYQRNCAETGRYKTAKGYRTLEIPAPLLRDVLYCLVMDSNVLDCATFEEWASEYGYDTDSRKAEATYRACLESALQLRALVGDDNLQKLREAYQDY